MSRRGFSSKRGEKGFVKKVEYEPKMCFAGSAVGVVVLVEIVTAVDVAGRVAIGLNGERKGARCKGHAHYGNHHHLDHCDSLETFSFKA